MSADPLPAWQPISVTLSFKEIVHVAVTGVMRQTENLKRGTKPAHGAKRDNDWQANIEGCLGEYAVAKQLGVFWSGAFGFKQSDLPGRRQVRWTSHDNGPLRLHPDDLDDDLFVLVIGINGKYRIMGQLRARDGKKQEYWGDLFKTGRPCFWVPQQLLEPLTAIG